MTKKELVERIKKLLKAGDDLGFLMKLDVEELKTLIARIRERVDQVGRWQPKPALLPRLPQADKKITFDRYHVTRLLVKGL